MIKTPRAAAKPPKNESAYKGEKAMNKTHGSRKRDIQMFIKIKLFKGNIKKAIDIAERYHITPKYFGKLAKEIG